MRKILSLCLAAILLFGVAVSASAAEALTLHALWPEGGDTHPDNGQASRLPVSSFDNGYGAVLRLIPHFTIDSSGATPVSSGGFLDSAGQGWPMPDYNPANGAESVRPAVTVGDESVVRAEWVGFEYPHVALIAMGAGSTNVTITDKMGKQAVMPVTISGQRGQGYDYNGALKMIGSSTLPFSIVMPQYVQPAFALMQDYAAPNDTYYAMFASVPFKLGHKMIYRAREYSNSDELVIPENACLIIPDRMIWSLGNTRLRVEGTLVIERGGYLNLFAEAGENASIEMGQNGAIYNAGLLVATEQSMLTDALLSNIDGPGAVGLVAYSNLTWDAGGNYDPNGDAVAQAGNVTIVKRPLLDAAEGTALERAAAAAGYSAFGEKFELQAWSGARTSANVPAEGIISTLPEAKTVSIPYAIESGATYKAAHKLQDGSIVYETLRASANGAALEMTISECSPFMIVKQGGAGGGGGGSASISSGFSDFDLEAWRKQEAKLKEKNKTPIADVPATGGAAYGMLPLLLAGAALLLEKRRAR